MFGTLIGVSFRSFQKCKIPEVYAPLLHKAELANIPAHVLANEYRSFIDIADKLALQGVEMSKLAKSISNIAFLKSEQVLGLPTHAVESSLNNLLNLVSKAPANHKDVPSTSLPLPKQEDLALKKAAASNPVVDAVQSLPNQNAWVSQPQVLQQMQNGQQQHARQYPEASNPAADRRSRQSVLPAEPEKSSSALPSPIPSNVLTNHAPLKVPIPRLKDGAAKADRQILAGVTGNAHSGKIEASSPLGNEVKVGILAVRPPVVSTAADQIISIEGCCARKGDV